MNYRYESAHEAFNWWLVFGPIIAIILLGWLATCVVITRQQSIKIIEVLGKYSGYRKAGLSFKPPFPIGIVAEEVDLRTYQLVMEILVKTKDNAFLTIPIKAQLQVILEKVYEAVYALDDTENQISAYIENFVRAHANTMMMEDVYASREEFQDAVLMALKERFEQCGQRVISVLVDQPQPSDEVRAAFDRVIASKRELEAAQNEAEAKRTRIVGEAKAHAESLELRAKSYVEQRKTVLSGMKDVLRDLGHERILSFLERIDMRDTIRDAANGPGNVVVVPMGMSGEFDIGKVAAMQKAMGNGTFKSALTTSEQTARA